MESLLSLAQLSRRRRNIILACCALGAGCYVSYRVCTSPPVTRKRRQLYRLFHSLSSLLESAAQGSDCVGVLWKDLHTFLLSNQDEVPQTLKQLFRVGQNREFQSSLALLCGSVTEGVVSGLTDKAPNLQNGSDHGSALFQELSSQKEAVRETGRGGKDLGYQNGTDGRNSWRRRSSEDDYTYRRGKLERSESASRIDDRFSREEDDTREHFTWKASRSYYRVKGSWAGMPVAETGGDAGKGKSWSQGERRRRVIGRAEGLSELVVGKLFSEAGRGFVSTVVASAARSLVLSVLEGMRDMRKRNSNCIGEKLWISGVREAEEGTDPRKKGAETDGISEEIRKNPTSSQDAMIEFICSSKGKSLMADCIDTFTGTAVSTYLDKTRDVNVYEEILSTISEPAHREPVKELLTAVCNGAVETLIRASHEVISSASFSGTHGSEPQFATFEVGSSRHTEQSGFSLGENSSFKQLGQLPLGESCECGRIDGANNHFTSRSPSPRTPHNHDAEGLSVSGLTRRIDFDHSPQSEEKVPINDMAKVELIVLPTSSSRQTKRKTVLPTKPSDVSQGWIDGVSRTLAVPSNRALVLDVAGTVTSEAIRSAIEAVASKVSHKLRGKSKEKEPVPEVRPSTSKVLQVINKTGELAQATAAKAMVASTVCLAICLHTLVGPTRGLLHS